MRQAAGEGKQVAIELTVTVRVTSGDQERVLGTSSTRFEPNRPEPVEQAPEEPSADRVVQPGSSSVAPGLSLPVALTPIAAI